MGGEEGEGRERGRGRGKGKEQRKKENRGRVRDYLIGDQQSEEHHDGYFCDYIVYLNYNIEREKKENKLKRRKRIVNINLYKRLQLDKWE